MKNLFIILSLFVSAQSFAVYDHYCGGSFYKVWIDSQNANGFIESYRAAGLFGGKRIKTDSARLTGQWIAEDRELESTEHAQLSGQNKFSYWLVFDLRRVHIYIGGVRKGSLNCRPY